MRKKKREQVSEVPGVVPIPQESVVQEVAPQQSEPPQQIQQPEAQQVPQEAPHEDCLPAYLLIDALIESKMAEIRALYLARQVMGSQCANHALMSVLLDAQGSYLKLIKYVLGYV
ncbi:MAG: hypothetical protein ABWK05_07105 [Pyrobaculum sp.]